MSSRRVLKMGEAIRETVSMAILTDLKDPRIEQVTVTFVEVSGDMRHAKVHVSIMGDDRQQKRCLHGLQSAAGYLQRKVSDRVETRYTPQLKFVLDMGVKKSIELSRILSDVLPREVDSDAAGSTEAEDADRDEDAGTVEPPPPQPPAGASDFVPPPSDPASG